MQPKNEGCIKNLYSDTPSILYSDKDCHPARRLLSGEIHGEALPLQDRFTGEANAQLLEYLMVNIAQHHGAMHLTTTQLGQLLQRAPAVVIVLREHRERHEHLVGMQSGVAATQITDFCMLDRLDHRLRYELHLMVDASQMLGDVEQESCAATEQLTGVRGDDGAVLQLDGRRCVLRGIEERDSAPLL